AEFSVRIGPLIPDADAALLQPFHISLAAQEPQQLDDDRLEVKLLGGEQGKPLAQLEPHLPAEYAARARTGPVAAIDAVVEDVFQEIEILPHRCLPTPILGSNRSWAGAGRLARRALPPALSIAFASLGFLL